MTSSSQFFKFTTQLIEVSDGYDDADTGQYTWEDYAEEYLNEDYAELEGQALLDEADYYCNLYLDDYSHCQGKY
jgi:hypothetical protein